MVCENLFCIYYSNRYCILEKVSLDILGCCQECIYIEFSEEELAWRRKKLLERFAEEK